MMVIFFAEISIYLYSRKLATKPCYVTPAHETYDDLETMYWDELVNDKSDPPIYGADVCQSITDPVTILFYLIFTNIPTHDSPTEGRSVRKKNLHFPLIKIYVQLLLREIKNYS